MGRKLRWRLGENGKRQTRSLYWTSAPQEAVLSSGRGTGQAPLIIAATVITVESETVLLIDEPERHLHRSIIEPFLSALFQRRQDCAFIISTHEIALPAANPEARVLMVRSCEWNGDTAKAWDVEILEANTNLPAELRRDILGARRRILFVEGTTNGLDAGADAGRDGATVMPWISLVGCAWSLAESVWFFRNGDKL